MTGALVVIGAINVDLVVRGARLPDPGETVTGGVFEQHHGGKGGNQAVAAARALGGSGVVLIGSVGNDALGHEALEALRAEGVAVSVSMRPGVATGVALICVDDRGENQISVAPGANAKLTASDVTGALGQMNEVGAVLASLEVPKEAVRAAAMFCSEHGVPFILNPAPAQPWARELATLADYLTPNELELEALGDPAPGSIVVETRGSAGAFVHRGSATTAIEAPAVDPVDTTGAGDCFNGVFAAGLVEGFQLEDAVRRAVVAASMSVTKPGARAGMPTREMLKGAIGA